MDAVWEQLTYQKTFPEIGVGVYKVEEANSGVILIVDDTPSNLQVLFACLESTGFKVLVAQNGEDALQIATSEIPDLILLDILMPDLDGFAVCRQIKANAQTKHIPVIFMTALTETINKVKGFEVGGIDYLTKPIEQEEVLVRIRTHLKLQKMQRCIQGQNEQLQSEISRRQQAEQELIEALDKERELNQLKSHFIAMTSHQFRTPLTTILGSMELLQCYSDRLSLEKRKNHFSRIRNNVKHMTQMLDDILLIGQDEAEGLKFNPTPTNVVDFCQDVVANFQDDSDDQSSIIFTHQGIYTENDSNWPLLDQKILHHVLDNLLSNALKYSPPTSQVDLVLECQEKQLVFRVKDRGMGIPFSDQKHLFEPFYRASNTDTVHGTGLGLTIVKKAVDLHGGTITFESDPNLGTTFTVMIASC
ncbi:MAG: hybrid sensor histidine kinase/response regulator [Spirulinaceae cyanobacterium]